MNEFDVVKLKKGEEVTLLHFYGDGYIQVENADSNIYEIKTSDILKVIEES